MYLKSLEISGFKSFSKKAGLHFSTPISAIVGPNGSGKSNVAEAFRFVLGEQSIKSLRGKKGEDLIFNGGDAGSRVNRASVKVVFDNSKRTLNIDFDEVTIERVVHRDSSNEYFINGSHVRLRDVIELLAGAHIGASGHHIISQGEADRILSANIKERREMIEDALGLKIYQYKKTESQKKLEKTEENMKQVESLRREIAPHLKFLKKQVEKLEKTEEMKRELCGLYKEYFASEDAYIKHERARIDREKKEPHHEYQKLEAELADAKKILAESKSRDAKSDHVVVLEQKIHAARTDNDRISREFGKIEGEIAAAQRQIEREKARQSHEDHKTVYLRDVEELVKRVDAHIGKAHGLHSIDELHTVFSAVKELLFGFIGNHKTKEDTRLIEESEKEIATLQKQKKSLEDAREQAAAEEKKLESAYAKLREEIEREKDSDRDAEKNVFKIVARQNELRSLLALLKAAEEKLVMEEAAFKRELQEAYVIVGREAVDYTAVHFSESEHARHTQEDRRRVIEKIKIRIEDSGGGNSGEILKEHKEVEERDAFLARELVDLEKSKESLLALIADLDARLDFEFKEGILKINAQFQDFFALMFGGGSASLGVVREKKRRARTLESFESDSEEMMANMASLGNDEEMQEEGPEGIEINVSLPRKKVKSLMMLSGGERALTSIALLFAISQVNPPPFIILDETDAALDEANSRKYGNMIENLSKYSQLILITHNRETMSRAGILYGVTMGSDGGSKLLSIQFEEAVKVAK